MSIKVKLMISQIIMAIIPITLLIAMNFFIPATFIKGLENNFNMKIDKRPPGEAQGQNMQPKINVPFITTMNFEKSGDIDYIKNLDEKLFTVDQGIIIRKNDKIVYISPFLKNTDMVKKLPAFGSFFDAGGAAPPGKVGGVRKFFTRQKDIYFKDGSTGSVFLVLRAKPIVQPFNRQINFLVFVLALFVILINGAIIFFITRGIIEPIESLKKAARQIKNNNLNYELGTTSKDELGELCSDFEEMRIKLKESIEIQKQYEVNRTELISNISHDLKTPITSIKGYIEGVLDGVANSPEKVDRYLKTAYSKVISVDLLIDELFLFSRLDLKKIPFDFEKVDIHEYLQDCYEELLLDAEEKSILLRWEEDTNYLQDNINEKISKEPVIVMADRDKLRRVITNIVGNSIKYMGKEHGEIKMSLKDEGEQVLIKIQDNGQGISKESLPFIFERFYRSDSSRNSSTGGSGLGLAIVKRIVEEHGGKIWAESIEGIGTSMFFTLKKVKECGKDE